MKAHKILTKLENTTQQSTKIQNQKYGTQSHQKGSINQPQVCQDRGLTVPKMTCRSMEFMFYQRTCHLEEE